MLQKNPEPNSTQHPMKKTRLPERYAMQYVLNSARLFIQRYQAVARAAARNVCLVANARICNTTATIKLFREGLRYIRIMEQADRRSPNGSCFANIVFETTVGMLRKKAIKIEETAN